VIRVGALSEQSGKREATTGGGKMRAWGNMVGGGEGGGGASRGGVLKQAMGTLGTSQIKGVSGKGVLLGVGGSKCPWSQTWGGES